MLDGMTLVRRGFAERGESSRTAELTVSASSDICAHRFIRTAHEFSDVGTTTQEKNFRFHAFPILVVRACIRAHAQLTGGVPVAAR